MAKQIVGLNYFNLRSKIRNGWTIEGVIRGRIAFERSGKGGFGYDSVFVPDGYDKTFAELPPEIKNSISHRAVATKKLVAYLMNK